MIEMVQSWKHRGNIPYCEPKMASSKSRNLGRGAASSSTGSLRMVFVWALVWVWRVPPNSAWSPSDLCWQCLSASSASPQMLASLQPLRSWRQGWGSLNLVSNAFIRKSVMIGTVNTSIIVLLGRDFCIDILEVQVHSSLAVR